MNNDQYGKTVIIGLDGATFTLLEPLMDDGTMPNLKGLVEQGASAFLRSTAHPLTPPAWTSLMTGRTPGNHGVFDFIRVDRETKVPSYTLATSADVRSETIWSMASRQGARITALNYPMMFPAPKLDGFIVPGYVPWSYLSRAMYPRGLYKRLKARQGFDARELSTDWQQERTAVQGLSENQLQDWVKFHIVRERRWADILFFLMEEEPCPLTGVLFDGVDRIQHLCYHLIDPDTAGDYTTADALETRELCLQYYRELDSYIGKIVEIAGSDAHIILASDHGFCRAGDRIFYANSWLEQQGLLRWRDGVAIDDQGRMAMDENTESSALIEWPDTLAYALSSSSNAIHIRVAREPGAPGVRPEEYETFRQKLIDDLYAIRDPETGEQVVVEILTREQGFPGRHCADAPDLTLTLSDLSFLSILRSDQPIKPRHTPYGTHHPDGIFIGAGPGFANGIDAGTLSICDVAATALYTVGLGIPDDMEGVVSKAAFQPEYLQAHPVRHAGASETADADASTLPEEEQAQIRERLKALGYL